MNKTKDFTIETLSMKIKKVFRAFRSVDIKNMSITENHQ